LELPRQGLDIVTEIHSYVCLTEGHFFAKNFARDNKKRRRMAGFDAVEKIDGYFLWFADYSAAMRSIRSTLRQL
jgi:hypothetical protein